MAALAHDGGRSGAVSAVHCRCHKGKAVTRTSSGALRRNSRSRWQCCVAALDGGARARQRPLGAVTAVPYTLASRARSEVRCSRFQCTFRKMPGFGMHIPEARCHCCVRPGCTALQCSCRQAAARWPARDGGAAAASRAERTSSRALRHPAALRSEVQPRISRLEADPTQRADTAGRLLPVTAAIDGGACSFPGCHRLRTLAQHH